MNELDVLHVARAHALVSDCKRVGLFPSEAGLNRKPFGETEIDVGLLCLT